MKKTTSKDIVETVQTNHIWLNAFQCVNPTDEYLRDIGRSIIDMLSRKDNLLPSYLDDDPQTGSVLEELANITPVLYLSINKS